MSFPPFPASRKTSEIILNLKELALILHADVEKQVEIIAEGPGVVTAADIRVDSEVEVVNPDLHIATLSEGTKLHMTLNIERGYGYVSAERSKPAEQKVIGMIPIDAIYTPLRKVNYTVEDTRVGQITDYDKLVLEVWTNGAVTPEEAIGMAAKILVNQLGIFTRLTDQPVIHHEEETETGLTGKVAELTIDELDLSVRAFNCLKRAGINTMAELVQKPGRHDEGTQPGQEEPGRSRAKAGSAGPRAALQRRISISPSGLRRNTRHGTATQAWPDS